MKSYTGISFILLISILTNSTSEGSQRTRGLGYTDHKGIFPFKPLSTRVSFLLHFCLSLLPIRSLDIRSSLEEENRRGLDESSPEIFY